MLDRAVLYISWTYFSFCPTVIYTVLPRISCFLSMTVPLYALCGAMTTASWLFLNRVYRVCIGERERGTNSAYSAVLVYQIYTRELEFDFSERWVSGLFCIFGLFPLREGHHFCMYIIRQLYITIGYCNVAIRIARHARARVAGTYNILIRRSKFLAWCFFREIRLFENRVYSFVYNVCVEKSCVRASDTCIYIRAIRIFLSFL